jgi:hypothetical protein
MSLENVKTYLNDHLAGSVAALDLIEYLREKHSDLRAFLGTLSVEIKKDQDSLKELLKILGGEEKQTAKTLGWIAEKISRIKLEIGQIDKNELGVFEAIEFLLIGIRGKKELWRALKTVRPAYPKWEKVNFEDLERRADEQINSVENKRLELVQIVLTNY